MNLYEYQGKKILSSYGLKIQKGILIDNIDEAVKSAIKLYEVNKINSWVIKSQIKSGGRGKAGGIIIVNKLDDIFNSVKKLLGKKLVTNQTNQSGELVRKIFICEDVYYNIKNYKELYFSIFFDSFTSKIFIIYSIYGGMDIEHVSIKYPKSIFKEEINILLGIQEFQIRKIFFNLNIDINFFDNFKNFVKSLYTAFINSDALLLEINPLLHIIKHDGFIIVDTKMIIDDNSFFRHAEYVNMNILNTDNDIENDATKYGLNFISMKGDIGCVVNGAGLAMATMDLIKSEGLSPANFLDIGGTADVDRIKTACDIILRNKFIKLLFFNIYAGIVRCDIIVQGIIKFYQDNFDRKDVNFFNIPIVLRLKGTNYNKAINMIKKSTNISNIYLASSLENSLTIIKKILSI